MKEGDYILTPRFLHVRIAEVFETEKEARENGYVETTDYKWEHDDGWNVLGKSIGYNLMTFAACKVEKKGV